MTTTISADSHPVAIVADMQSKAADRLFFIDNIRVFLTILVILHHLMVIYAGSGSWIYNENLQDDVTTEVGRWFCSINQSYFMGLFLLISAYFVPGSYDRKGARRFLQDRFIRIGIPLAVYGWIVRPLWIFAAWSIQGSFWNWYTSEYFKVYGIIGGGPLWFIETLLIFALLYALYRRTIAPHPAKPISDTPFPGNGRMVLLAFLLGIASFVIRLWFPRNTSITELNLQLANFPQYIALFVVGLMAYPRKWLVNLPEKTGHRWLIIALALSILPLLVGFDGDQKSAGGDWILELVSAWWESFMCVGMCIGVIYLFRNFANQQGRLEGWFSRNAYTAYLIHEPLITSIALVIASVAIYPLLKFAMVSLVAVPASFLVGALIRKIPYSNRVL